MKRLALVFFILGVAITFGYMSNASAGNFNTTSANDAGWSKLTTEQQAKILSEISTNANTSQSQGQSQDITNIANPENTQVLNKWVEASNGIGNALVNLVQKLGVTVNEFLKTPAGLLTAGMLFWYVMGNSIIHLVFSLAFVALGVSLIVYSLRRTTIKSITRERTGFFQWKKVIAYYDVSDADKFSLRVYHFLAFIIVFGLGIWIL